VLADDPLLTARFPGAPRQPVRIVLDTGLRTPLGAQVVRTARDAATWIVAGPGADAAQADALRDAGVEILTLPADNRIGVDLHALMAELGRRDVISILVEGGGSVHSSFLRQGHVHKLLWFIAP